MVQKLYVKIATAFDAHVRCKENNNKEWEDKHKERIISLCSEHLPSGNGFDNGTTFDFENSTDKKLIFLTSYHHMSENGYYSHWTDHKVTIRPDFVYDFDMKITNTRDCTFEEYIYGVFNDAFNQEVEIEK